jgi:hypothetical protein
MVASDLGEELWWGFAPSFSAHVRLGEHGDSVGQGLEARSRRMEGWGEFTWMRMLLLLW